MKKILLLILALVLCLGIVSCVESTETPDDNTDTGVNDGGNNDGGGNATEKLQDAMDILWDMYRKYDRAEIGASFDVVTNVNVGDLEFAVEWTVDNTAITLTEKEGNLVTVVIPEASEDIAFKLTATIKDSTGASKSKDFSITVPKFKITSLEEYLNSETGKLVIVEGYVVAINSKGATNTRNHLFLVDESLKGGYYAYNMAADPVVDLGIEIGMKVRISGSVEQYGKNDSFGGMPEIKDGVATIVDSNKVELSPVDITNAFVSANDLRAFSGAVVTVKGVTLGGQKLGGSSDYLYFSINGIESYVRSYLTDLEASIKSEATKAAIDADHEAHFGYTADVTGVLIFYGSTPYIIPVSVAPFTNYQLPERSDAEKIEMELGAIELPEKVTEKVTITLPLAGSTYDEVVFSWASDNACAVITDGKLVITLPEEACKVTLTVSAKVGDGEAVEKTFEIAVSAMATDLYVPKADSKPVADKAYKFGLFQVNLGKYLYINGIVDGRYLGTTEVAAEAADVYAEVAEGGFKFYILVDGAKQYITVYNNDAGKLSVKFDAAGTSVYAYNETVNAWVTNMDGTDYYLGTYNSFNTISASKLSYINADNTGVSQFPANLYTLVVKEVAPVSKNEPAADTAYKFAVTQVNLGKVLYVTGNVDGRYLETTDKISQAADVYAEAAEGGFKFYILVDGAKQYITVYNNDAGKLSVKFDAAGASVYAYNETVNAWVTNMDGTDYYLGTYNSFNTISASKLSYINADNTGVSQFPANIVAIEFVTEGGDDVTPPAGGDDNTGDDNTGDDNTGDDNTGDDTTSVTTIPGALAAADGTAVVLRGVVVSADAWNTTHNNMSVTIKDADGNTIYVYRLGTQVGLGDEIIVTGIMGSYYESRQVAQGATAEIVVVHGDNHTYVEGFCSVCGAAELVAGETTVNCDFSTVAKGVQYADESVTFGDYITVSTHNKGCHFNTQLRLYASDSNNGYAVITSTKVISGLVINSGYKAATLEVYGSVDGETWTPIQNISTTAAYANANVAVDSALGYKYIKLDATGAQIRVASIDVTVVE